MRVQFVITRGETYGGAQRHVIEMASALHREGHTVQVLCGPGKVVPKKLYELGVESVLIPSLSRSPLNLVSHARAYREIKGAIREFQPDILSTHSSVTGILGRRAAYQLGVPAIFTAHGWSFSVQAKPAPRAVWRVIERRAAGWCQRILCVSEAGRQLALQVGLPARKLITVYNCRPDVDPSLRAHHQDRHLVTITMIGRMDVPKDHQLLLEAVARIEGCRLEIIGDGPEQGFLEGRAKELGITDRVSFLGLVQKVEIPLARADIFCLVSRSEGFPRSTLEGMRAALPVVVSDVGGAAEAIEKGVTGFAVPSGDGDALQQALETLVRDPELRARMGAAGRRRYEENFTFDRMFEATVAIYEQVLEKEGRAP